MAEKDGIQKYYKSDETLFSLGSSSEVCNRSGNLLVSTLKCFNSFSRSGLERRRRAVPGGCQSALTKPRSTYILRRLTPQPRRLTLSKDRLLRSETDAELWVPTPFSCRGFFFLCITLPGTGTTKSRAHDVTPATHHTNHTTRMGEGAFQARGRPVNPLR